MYDSLHQPTFRELTIYSRELADYFQHKMLLRIEKVQDEFGLLLKKAKNARLKARTFKTAVGVGIQMNDGEIFTAGNIENSSRFFDRHAEFVASEKAMMADGKKYQKKDFIALAVNTTKYAQYAVPTCAGCRQWLWENTHPELEIIVFNSREVVLVIPLRLVYPLPWPREPKPRIGE
jgi:cytidine deaminase